MSTIVYYSSATSDLAVKKRQQSLQFLLDKKKRQYTMEDLAQMEKPQRDELYAKANVRIIPMVFHNGKYIGGQDELQMAEEDEIFDSLFQ
ncbi:glutaredoxin, GrxC family protein [Planoprotostelium fungivorum]|uniref:Glutaredoxin, GrxC family protein n=1 Tax=Planoprotostelium fungivorum TaxID=1890364 RepID=A0A2P6P014_9EUKA|nr:glutaredoxin, GrxC family protein [Planoprotostelium fungivorum]